jgi:hypothetical protein
MRPSSWPTDWNMEKIGGCLLTTWNKISLFDQV